MVNQMDEDRRKAKKLIIILFLSCLCAAFVCFGISAYLFSAYQRGALTGGRIAVISKIIVMTGVFFLVLAFGNLLPLFAAHKKREQM